MICVTRLNDSVFYINPDLIEFIEETPNTVISFSTGRKVVVRETCGEIIDRIISFKNKVFREVYITDKSEIAESDMIV
ncbi:MAG: flagellar FlbD family protein [Oscillospiraceae bacterium]|nr:flagellar FlbD family protein [Oscillospiraceae bacterium]